MINFQSKSLRARLMIPISCVVIAIIALISFVLIWSEKNALQDVASNVSVLAEEVKDQQETSVQEIETGQIKVAENSLNTKAESMANLVAGLAPTVILTFDYDVLDDYCFALSQDPDIVLAYFTDSSGQLLTSFRNETDQMLLSLVNDAESLSLEQLKDQLISHEMILNVSKEIFQDQEVLGGVTILVSRAAAQKQAESIKSEFNAMTVSVGTLFDSLQQGVKEQVQSATRKSIWISESLVLFS